ncbi:MAG: molecular chaperone HtpG [Bacteroidota bacterium]
MQQGSINVQTENIFPIIKKFLYSDHEIFLRELVSNAVDATQKLRTLVSLGELKADLEKSKVEVILDKENKKLTIRDNGIGMTQEEVDKYINQIAFSGAEEFVEKYKDKSEAIIGHFGLGFYSSFMVAERVDIISKSQRPNSTPVKWSCDGSPNFTMEEAKKKTKGTDIVLHIHPDSEEFLEEGRIQGILDKYCKFLPVDIHFGTKTESVEDGKDEEGKTKYKTVDVANIINNTSPAWTKAPADLSDEDYKKFYRELYPMNFDEPLFHIHLNVDYPFNLTGIMYFPKLKNNVEIQKNKINLYSNQVFITDNVEDIVPEFLTLLHGVIDSPDIPLNVSRSYLQSDSNVKKISNHISKKVADKLSQMFKNEREEFEGKWEDIKVFMEYGMLTDDKFYDRAQGFYLMKNTEGTFKPFEEYKESIAKTQKDKNNKIICLYTHDTEEHHAYITAAKEKGYDVLELNSPLSSHITTLFERKYTDVQFVRVDSNSVDKLIETDEEIPCKLSKEQEEALKPLVEGIVDKEKYAVSVESMNEGEAPILITQSEFMRRMKEQQLTGGGMMMGMMPDMYNLVVNSNHPLIGKIVEAKKDDEKSNLLEQAIDLAMLSQGLLKGEKMTNFIKRSLDLIK